MMEILCSHHLPKEGDDKYALAKNELTISLQVWGEEGGIGGGNSA
jgi:hypothetical protein